MTNRELQEELKKYPKDFKVIIFYSDILGERELKTVRQGRIEEFKTSIIVSNYLP